MPVSSCLYRSTLDGLLKIIKHEGYRVLYRGMDLNLIVGVPMVSSVVASSSGS